jgi:hypothetical protein
MNAITAWTVLWITVALPIVAGLVVFFRVKRGERELFVFLLLWVGWLPAGIVWSYFSPVFKPPVPEPIPAPLSSANAARMWAAVDLTDVQLIPVKSWRVIDGMTIAVMVLDREYTLKLAGVRVPPHMSGTAVSLIHELFVFGEAFMFRETGKTSDGTLLVDAYATHEDLEGGVWLNSALVAAGFAYSQSDDLQMKVNEDGAKRERRGLWE